MERPSPPYSSGIERPNRPSARISATSIVGNGVVFGDLGFERDQPLVDEAADGVEQGIEGFGVEGHSLLPSSPLLPSRERVG